MNVSVAALVVGLVVTGCATATGTPVPAGRPHDFALVVASESPPAGVLTSVCDSVGRAVASAMPVEPGYPRPCRIRATPDERNPPQQRLTCVEPTSTAVIADGLRLDPDGHFLRFGIVDFPDSRLYLMEVYLVPEWPYPDFATDRRWHLPRVTIHFPVVPAAWFPQILTAIEQGVRAAGALPAGGSR
ncbi:MAG: hypothetical protein HYR51_06150 [Candidatus Rokubacteria bacterium]|nr:hypothetical protein [Candidatus Rokubacteria bacterium]